MALRSPLTLPFLLVLLLLLSPVARGRHDTAGSFPTPSHVLLDRRSSDGPDSPHLSTPHIPSEPFPSLSGAVTDRTTGDRTTDAWTHSVNELRLSRAVSDGARAHAVAQNPRLAPAHTAALMTEPHRGPRVDLDTYLRGQRLRAATPEAGAARRRRQQQQQLGQRLRPPAPLAVGAVRARDVAAPAGRAGGAGGGGRGGAAGGASDARAARAGADELGGACAGRGGARGRREDGGRWDGAEWQAVCKSASPFSVWR